MNSSRDISALLVCLILRDYSLARNACADWRGNLKLRQHVKFSLNAHVRFSLLSACVVLSRVCPQAHFRLEASVSLYSIKQNKHKSEKTPQE